METFVATLLWLGAALGLIAVFIAIRVPRWRRLALIVATLLFLPIGVFGILSIGALFIVAAAVCVAAAVLVRSPSEHSPDRVGHAQPDTAIVINIDHAVGLGFLHDEELKIKVKHNHLLNRFFRRH